MTLGNTLLHTAGVGHHRHLTVEEGVEFAVVHTQTHYCRHFLFHELFYLAIVVALVFAAKYEHHRIGHALERIPCAVDIGGL